MKASVKTWIDQVESGNVKHNTAKVLNYIKSNSDTYDGLLFTNRVGTTIDEIKKDLGLRHPTATSCITNLTDAGLIKGIGQIKTNYESKGKSRSITYTLYTYVYDRNERIRLSSGRSFTKFNDWINRGLKEFSQYLSESEVKALKEIKQGIKDYQVIN